MTNGFRVESIDFTTHTMETNRSSLPLIDEGSLRKVTLYFTRFYYETPTFWGLIDRYSSILSGLKELQLQFSGEEITEVQHERTLEFVQEIPFELQKIINFLVRLRARRDRLLTIYVGGKRVVWGPLLEGDAHTSRQRITM